MIAEIAEQYQGVVGALNGLFTDMGERSHSELWRDDGVGSCVGVDTLKSGYGFVGEAANYFHFLRRERNKSIAGKSTLTSCAYHRAGQGCVLGDLKSPMCTSHIDMPNELERTFGIDGLKMERGIQSLLRSVLVQDSGLVINSAGAKMPMSDFYPLVLEMIDSTRRHVRTFPVLTEEDREERAARSFVITVPVTYQSNDFR